MRTLIISVTLSVILAITGFRSEEATEDISIFVTPILQEVQKRSQEKMKAINLDEEIGHFLDYQIEEEKRLAQYRQERQEEFNTKKDAIVATTKKEWFLKYKDLIKEYSEWVEVYSIYDYYTKDEIYLMQRCVETECYQRSFDSKVNVACVIFNRLVSDGFPNDIYSVITTYRQFAYVKTDISEDTILALEYAFLFNTMDSNILFFHSGQKTDTFNGASYAFSDDAVHHFYKVD